VLRARFGLPRVVWYRMDSRNVIKRTRKIAKKITRSRSAESDKCSFRCKNNRLFDSAKSSHACIRVMYFMRYTERERERERERPRHAWHAIFFHFHDEFRIRFFLSLRWFISLRKERAMIIFNVWLGTHAHDIIKRLKCIQRAYNYVAFVTTAQSSRRAELSV